MSISCDQLCIFFATEDNQNRPNWKNKYDDNYDLQGFYVKIDLEGIPSPWPDEINCILGKFYEHFIWISKRICESEDIHFAWIYAHELQHLKQSLKNPYLLIVAKLLKYVKYEIVDIDIPTEFECDGKAKHIVARIFGEEKSNAYINKMSVGSKYNEARYGRLLQLKISPEYDVEEEIQRAIYTNIKTLKEFQKQMQNSASTNWNIDIDRLCKCENPHNAIMSSVTKISFNDTTF